MGRGHLGKRWKSSGYFGASGAPKWQGPAGARIRLGEGFRNLSSFTLRWGALSTQAPGLALQEVLCFPMFLTRIFGALSAHSMQLRARAYLRARILDAGGEQTSHRETPTPAPEEATTEPGPSPPASPHCLGSQSAGTHSADLSLRRRSTPHPQALGTSHYDPTHSEVLKFGLGRDTGEEAEHSLVPSPALELFFPHRGPPTLLPVHPAPLPPPAKHTNSPSASQKGGRGLWVNRDWSKGSWGRGSRSLFGPASYPLPPYPAATMGGAGSSAGCQVGCQMVTHLHTPPHGPQRR